MEEIPDVLPLRGIVPVSRADLWLVRNAAHLDANCTKLPIACFICRIVPQTVLRTDFVGYLSQGGASILQTRRDEILAAACLRQVVHLPTGEVVKIAADLHPLKRTHLAKV